VNDRIIEATVGAQILGRSPTDRSRPADPRWSASLAEPRRQNHHMPDLPATDLLYLRDAYLRSFTSEVVAVRTIGDGVVEVALTATAFYPTGGGQPHDTGTLAGAQVIDVAKGVGDESHLVWHRLQGEEPTMHSMVEGVVDWERRHRLMRTHTALHVLCGVIWNEWRVPVTGGNMEPLTARMDFEFDPLPEGFAVRVEQLVNAELRADRAIAVDFLPRDTAVRDADLIRTKVNMIPDAVTEIRVVDIVGLDKQADGGTHVRSTGEVGQIRVLKVENKGKGNKRVRLEVIDA
jgi:misacylated tRNA(Ala) deacylase